MSRMYLIELMKELRTFGEWVVRNAKNPDVRKGPSLPRAVRDFIELIDDADEDGSLRVKADYDAMRETALTHMVYRLTCVFRGDIEFVDPARPFEQPDWMTDDIFTQYRCYGFLPDLRRAMQENQSHTTTFTSFANLMAESRIGLEACGYLAPSRRDQLVARLGALRKPLLEALPKLLNVTFNRGTNLKSEEIFDELVVATFQRTLEYLAAGYVGDDKEMIELYGDALATYLLVGVPLETDTRRTLFLKARAR